MSSNVFKITEKKENLNSSIIFRILIDISNAIYCIHLKFHLLYSEYQKGNLNVLNLIQNIRNKITRVSSTEYKIQEEETIRVPLSVFRDLVYYMKYFLLRIKKTNNLVAICCFRISRRQRQYHLLHFEYQ